MRFANLKPSSAGDGGTILVPSNDVDNAALLKARTLLAFLDQRQLLTVTTHGGWTLMHSADASHPIAPQWDDAGEDIAKIPYLPHVDIRDQPGVALVRASFEAVTLFRQVYLRSSVDWLTTRANVRRELDRQFNVAGDSI